MTIIEIVKGDITRQCVDAIVNAANTSLLGGGGVDGAIHRAAGPGLLKECTGLNGCSTGNAKITRGYDLTAKWVVHTPGPIWRGGSDGEPRLLAACYKNCFSYVEKHDIHSIAFPSIGTGVYGYPKAEACEIALSEAKRFIETDRAARVLEKIVFVCFSINDLELYERSYSEIF